MLAVRVFVPILGGSSFVLLSLLASLLDVIDEGRREAVRASNAHRQPDRILIRYVSAITYVPTSRSALCFFGGTVIFLISAALTGTWQSQIEGAGSRIAVSASIMGASIFLLSVGAWLYRVNVLVGTAVHMILAGVFQCVVIVYGFATQDLAKNQYGDAATTTRMRQIVLYIAIACLALSFLGFQFATKKTMKLLMHVRAEENLAEEATRNLDNDQAPAPETETETTDVKMNQSQEEHTMLNAEERQTCRKYEASLAIVQYMLGTCACLLLIFGAVDVELVSDVH